jgi:transcriptional regulator with XRE-family HTH domain
MRKMMGERIRTARLRKGMSQEELARLSGVSRVHISQMETARGSMSIANIRAIARVLGVGIDFLAGTFEDTEAEPALAL